MIISFSPGRYSAQIGYGCVNYFDYGFNPDGSPAPTTTTVDTHDLPFTQEELNKYKNRLSKRRTMLNEEIERKINYSKTLRDQINAVISPAREEITFSDEQPEIKRTDVATSIDKLRIELELSEKKLSELQQTQVLIDKEIEQQRLNNETILMLLLSV